jgi:hypothetical protein
MSVLVKAGTEIRDSDGVLVATIVHDLVAGDYLLPDYVRLADGRTPVEGEEMPKAVWEYLVSVKAI